MPSDAEFAALVEPFRPELLAHCYRILGSIHDAEDLVQETYLRAWRGFGRFEGRSSLRRWLYTIATMACLTALKTRSRRPLPSGLGAPSDDHRVAVAPGDPSVAWLQPAPDALFGADDPAAIVAGRTGVRLAFIAALQHLPARQRAVLTLRDVLAFRTAEVAEMLDTTNAAVDSALRCAAPVPTSPPPARSRTTWSSRTRKPGAPSSTATSTRSPGPTPTRWCTCCGPTSSWRCRRSPPGSPAGKPGSGSWPVACCAARTSGGWCPPAPTAKPLSSPISARPRAGTRRTASRCRGVTGERRDTACYMALQFVFMKVISQREFRNNSAAVMDAVEAGEVYHVTRNGVEIAELRPVTRRRRLTADELVERHRRLPRVDHDRMRDEADEFFGGEDRVDGGTDPAKTRG
jgi:prevent-host-death family protein